MLVACDTLMQPLHEGLKSLGLSPSFTRQDDDFPPAACSETLEEDTLRHNEEGTDGGRWERQAVKALGSGSDMSSSLGEDRCVTSHRLLLSTLAAFCIDIYERIFCADERSAHDDGGCNFITVITSFFL